MFKKVKTEAKFHMELSCMVGLRNNSCYMRESTPDEMQNIRTLQAPLRTS